MLYNESMIDTATRKIIRSKRRTLSLSVASDASIVIRAPMRLPVFYIEQFIARKRGWIERKIKQANTRLAAAPKFNLNQINKAEVLRTITEQVEKRAREMGVSFVSIKITSAAKRWGSCSHNGKLNFSYRLGAVPPEVLDYVVVHELAHIAHHNHSRNFWDKVRSACPDYKIHHKWLRDNHYSFEIKKEGSF